VELKRNPLDHQYWLNYGAYRQLKELEEQLAMDVRKLKLGNTAVNSIVSYKQLHDHLKDGAGCVSQARTILSEGRP